MHEFYVHILESAYGNVSPKSRARVATFYSSLPPPGELTQSWVRKRLRTLAPHTQLVYMSFLRPVSRALGVDLIGDMRAPRRPQVRKADLYSKEEVTAILNACVETRDRAMMAVLYESAMRAFELLQLRLEDIVPEQELWWLSVRGKRGLERSVPIMNSAPALQNWLNVHPVGKGPIFTTLDRPFRPLTYFGLDSRVRLIVSRAGVRQRHRGIHLFRHTRLTELALLGMSESSMCLFAGWELGSAETRVYVHLSGRDLKLSFRKLYGIAEPEEVAPMLKMESIVCPRCRTQNAPGARFCSQCSLTLSEDVERIMAKRPGVEREELDALRAQMAKIQEAFDVVRASERALKALDRLEKKRQREEPSP